MRVVPFVISTIITGALVFALNKKWGPVPPLGKFLSPQQGFWQNAEAADHDFSADLKLTGVKGKVEVYFDERLVPHVFAENDEIIINKIIAIRSWTRRKPIEILPCKVSSSSLSDKSFIIIIVEEKVKATAI